MADNYRPDYPLEQRLDQAARNWNSLFFAILDYLREQDLSPKEFVQWLGERYAPGWENVRGDLHQIAYFAALNPVALGGQLRRYEVDNDEAIVQTTIGHLGDRGDDVNLLAEIYGPIMEHLDLDYEWQREGVEGEAVSTLHLRRRP